jgi:hypothetical protein
MASIESRTEQFQSGTTPPAPYKATSVYDTLTKSPNGLADRDANRLLVGGGMLPSENGRSEDTAQKRRYLDNPVASV